jgi:starch phosphorylase
MMKESIRKLTPVFSGDRMVKNYTDGFYLPAAEHYERLAADGFAKAREVAAWKDRVRKAWSDVRVISVREEGSRDLPVGTGLPVRARVHLGVIEPSEVVVQAYFSRLRSDGTLRNGRGIDLEWSGTEEGDHIYAGTVPSRSSGMHGYSVRVLPRHDDVLVPHELPLIAWEEE